MEYVVEARYVSNYRLWLRFSDGTSGEVDLANELWGEVFEPLKNLDVFQSFSVDNEFGTVTWPTGADFAPEFLYSRVAVAA